MHKARLALLLPFAALPLVAGAHWFRDEEPPANARPLSEIIKTVETQAGEGRITEVEFDDGRWDIEVHRPGGTEDHIAVDAMTGQIVKP